MRFFKLRSKLIQELLNAFSEHRQNRKEPSRTFDWTFCLGFNEFTKGCVLALCQILRLLEPDHLPGAQSTGDGRTLQKALCLRICMGGATLARVVCSKHLFVHSFFYLQRVYQDILWYKVPQSTHIIEGKVVNFFYYKCVSLMHSELNQAGCCQFCEIYLSN